MPPLATSPPGRTRRASTAATADYGNPNKFLLNAYFTERQTDSLMRRRHGGDCGDCLLDLPPAVRAARVAFRSAGAKRRSA